MLGIVLVFIPFCLSVWYLWRRSSMNRYPPGPLSLPILGHLHLLGDHPEKILMSWEKKYGKIMACDLGSFPGVVLNDLRDIKEAFQDPAFGGRPKLRAFAERSFGRARGVIFSEGDDWAEQRRFTLRHLRDFGFGKGSQENLIRDEVVELIENLKKDAGKPITTRNRFTVAIINALWTMVAGTRLSHDDPQLQTVIRLTSDSMADPSPAALFMPWLTKLAPEWSGWNAFMADIQPTHDFLQTFLDEHKQSRIPNSPRDFTDAFLDEMEKTEQKNSSFYKAEGEQSLKVTLLDLFFASTETTSYTLSWAMLYLASNENQNIQERVHQEIVKVVGLERLPELADRSKMPYMEATIMETLRYSSLIPIGVWHSTLQDVEFRGFHIPKDTMIIPNLYAVHHDARLWGEDVDVFNPERFLNSDRTGTIRPEAFIPFSTGRRVCIGETLAKDELFLIIAAIFQTFRVDLNPNEPLPSLDPVPGPVSSPKPHQLIFNLRNN